MKKKTNNLFVEGNKLQVQWYDHVELDHRRTDKDTKYPPTIFITTGVYTRSDKMHRMIAHHYCPSDRECDDEMKILKRCIKDVQPAFNLDDIRDILLDYDIKYDCREGLQVYYYIKTLKNIADKFTTERVQWETDLRNRMSK